MQKKLLADIDTTSAALLEAIAAFDEEQFNQVPFEGSWTAGQVADHLIKGVSAEILYGNTAPTDRQPDVMVAPLADIFLNFETKLQSPDFVLPSAPPHEKEQSFATMQYNWEEIRKAAETLDLTATCLDFELPTMGHLTRLEWISFFLFHTQRHTRQMKRILQHLNSQDQPLQAR